MTQSQPNNLLEIRGLKVYFEIKGGILKRTVGVVQAVDGVNLDVRRGEILGLVGESGCGKTTVGRALLRLIPATAGSVLFDGQDMFSLKPSELKPLRRAMQLVFQDPYSSLDPRSKVGDIVGEGLRVHGITDRAERHEKVLEALKMVGLQEEHMRRFPHEFSGGQRQRIGIARALVLKPEFIVCDEPVSALDVSVQAAVLNVLARLQAERGTSYLFISHDLAVVGYLADDFAVMYLGELFEIGRGADLFAPPYHPYTEALLAAVPRADAAYRPPALRLHDDIPSPRAIPTGCRFHTRCPRQLGPLCEGAEPPWRDAGGGHRIRCHIPPDELAALQNAAARREEA